MAGEGGGRYSGAMQLDQYVNTLGRHLRSRFGERVHKLTLDAGFTCPNRDGTLGRGGCTFCNVRGFHRGDARESVAEQLRRQKAGVDRARRYLAYFQAYTSTYAEVELLRDLYESAVRDSDMVGLCVGTRPDCVPDAALDLLQDYRERGFEVWLELGLQSAFDETLNRINRGHGYAAYRDAVRRARARGIPICTHLILGLPGEDEQHAQISLNRVLEEGGQGLKLHPLMAMRGSRLGRTWRAGEWQPWPLERYTRSAADLIRHTPPSIVYHRVSANAHREVLLAPDWCSQRWPALQRIAQLLAIEGGQGTAIAS